MTEDIRRNSFSLLFFQLVSALRSLFTDAEMAWFDSQTLFVSASLFFLPLLVVCAVLCLPILAFATGMSNVNHEFGKTWFLTAVYCSWPVLERMDDISFTSTDGR